MHLSVVLPCFNEAENIEPAVRDTAAWLARSRIDGEVIVVNDGSRDSSAHILERLREECKNLTVVTHPVNQGYGVAVRSGCDAARGDVIAFMDSDRQFRAEDMGRLLPFVGHGQGHGHGRGHGGMPFVAGRRLKRADSLLRNVYGKLLGVLTWAIFGLWVRDINCGMKMFRRSLWPQIRPVHGVEKLFNTELFLNLKRLQIPWMQVDVAHYPRLHGSPTGGSLRVIRGMLREIWNLKMATGWQ